MSAQLVCCKSDRASSLLVIGVHKSETPSRSRREHLPLRKNPLVWFRWSFCTKSEQSPFRIVWHPSSSETCRLKSWRILMSAPLRPGISSPFLIRRMRRIGSISAPTFSSRPRMKALTTYVNTHRTMSIRRTYQVLFPSIAEDPPRGRHRVAPSRNQSRGSRHQDGR